MTHEEFKSVWLPLNATFYRTAWAVLGNEADAKDAVQELYVRLWNSKLVRDFGNGTSLYNGAPIKTVFSTCVKNSFRIGGMAVQLGWVCECGNRIEPAEGDACTCPACGKRFAMRDGRVGLID